MNAPILPVLSDHTWGILSLLMAAAVFVWLMFHLRRLSQTVVQMPLDEPLGTVPVEMISFATIFAEYQLRKNRCEADYARIDARLLALSEMRLESWEVPKLHSYASPAEVANLAAIVGLPAESSWAAIVEAIRKAGSHTVAKGWRGLAGRDPYVPYRAVLTDVAKKLDAKFAPDDFDAMVEKSIIMSSLEAALAEATPTQRAQLIHELDANTRKMGGVVAGVAGTVALANLSGFGLYVAASSVVGALTSAVGVTLPFAAYTGMSATIATLTGPVGWVAIIIAAAAVWGKVDYQKTALAVMAVAQVRMRLIAERDQSTWALLGEKDKLAPVRANVAELADLVERMRLHSLKFVPRASVPF